MKKVKYYCCPACGSISVSTGNATVSCCGRRLEDQVPQKADSEHLITCERSDDDWFLESAHPMEKGHYISFVAFATGERLEIIKQYPEWNLQIRLPKRDHGMLLWYCVKHGLFYKNI